MSTQSGSRDEYTPPPDETVDAATSAQLLGLGFDPGIPVYELEPVGFDLEGLEQALFGSTYRHPATVTFSSDKLEMQETPLEKGIEVLVESVQLFYIPREEHVGSGLVGCYPEPQWYLCGFVFKSGFDPYPETIRVHARLDNDSTDIKIDKAVVQFVREPSGADSSTPMLRARTWHKL